MMHRFEQQVAIVTGGARGIGEAIARRLASEGATVTLFDRRSQDVEKTSRVLREAGLAVHPAVVDISDETQVQRVIETVVRTHGRLDMVINSAGIVGPTATNVDQYPFDAFQEVVAINLHGAFLMVKHSVPHMIRQHYGRILLIASIGGKDGNPGMSGYVASKAGVMGLVKAAGKEYAETGVTVNGLAPAVIATPMNLDTAPSLLKYMSDKIPMKRLGSVEEVASLACWIVSSEASFNTGFVFDLSGGRATY